MSLHALFPTYVYAAPLKARSGDLNLRLKREAQQLRLDDAAGRRWSVQNYPGGFTSYGSVHRLHQLSPSFQALQKAIDRHVARFAASLGWELADRRLEMTDCWLNIMQKGAQHSLHLHPLSCISGTYYVSTPAGSPGLKFEDPRLDKFMAAPPRKSAVARPLKPWVTLPARAGALLLFESWLRHEVPVNSQHAERISVSFNYNWF
jgi:uncharacterized protein (TIGR02466 family)